MSFIVLNYLNVLETFEPLDQLAFGRDQRVNLRLLDFVFLFFESVKQFLHLANFKQRILQVKAGAKKIK